MKLSYYISVLLSAGVFMMASCSQEEELAGESNDLVQGMQLFVSDGGFESTETRAIDQATKTTFTDGDAIGVFAIRGGKIVENIDNRKFTFSEGVWELDGDVIEYKGTEFKKMKFYAYYPYSETITIDPAAEDPFIKVVQKWKVGTDQSGENYTKYDLMTSVGEAEGQRLQGKIAFTMQHRMGLAIIKMPTLTYSFTNGGIDDYHLPVAVGDFTIGNVAGKPYYDKTTGAYRVLVTPDTKVAITGTYSGVKDMEYGIEAELKGGVAKQYTIKDESKISHTLTVGDYFCADGMIVSNEADVPANCIGIVCYVGNPQPSAAPADPSYTETNDALRRDYPNCKHGLVIALKDAERSNNKITKFSNAKDLFFGNWFKSDEDWSDKFVACDTKAALPGLLGYNNTVLMERYNVAASDSAQAYMGTYRTEVPVPLSTTPWFIPSLKEFEVVAEASAVVNSQLTAAAGTPLIIGGAQAGKNTYWTSNERPGNARVVYQHNITVGSIIASSRDVGSNAAYFRFMLAF